MGRSWDDDYEDEDDDEDETYTAYNIHNHIVSITNCFFFFIMFIL